MRIANVKFWLFAMVLLVTALLPLRPAQLASSSPAHSSSIEWAEGRWVPQDAALYRLKLSPLEMRFARQFPGHIGRFSDGRHEWIVRVMNKPTRMLHPAADCFRGMGYDVTPPRVRIDSQGESWRCFHATHKGKRLRVCERIFDAHSGRWTDASSWYWSALLSTSNQVHGPWWAVTRVEAEE